MLPPLPATPPDHTMLTMPYLIDGNNLMPALEEAGPEVGREGLCRLLQPLLKQDPSVHVVFDGSVPPAGMAAQMERTGVKVTYSGERTADELILKVIAQDSAPKLLTVVSTDKEIRRAAERRRCKTVTSQEFALKLIHIDTARRKPRTPQSPEFKGKQKGLSAQDTRRWLQEFGFDDAGDEQADRNG
jgi:uncharacterized protein